MPMLLFSRFLYVVTNRYTVLNQKVLYLLQFFKVMSLFLDRLTGLVSILNICLDHSMARVVDKCHFICVWDLKINTY